MIKQIFEKAKESAFSVLPIYLLVIILNLTPIVNLTGKEVLAFSLATLFLVIGISLFNLGSDLAMTKMGQLTGKGLTKNGKIGVLLITCFILGFLVTFAEPDLSVLAEQTKNVFNKYVLIVSISVGVGGFLVFAILKTIHKLSLNVLLMYFYMLLFGISLVTVMTGNENIIPLAFDSGGVTTGPITVPFLMALGLGVSKVVSKKSEKDASFGIIALCSIGPIAITLLLSLFTTGKLSYELPNYDLDSNFILSFGKYFLERMGDVGIALGLIVLCFAVCSIFFLKINKKTIYQIIVGIIYTYFGLVIFLASVDSAYMSIGYKMGTQIAAYSKKLLVIIGFVIGALTVLAEPAIHVLNSQVQEITEGLVKKRSMMIALVIGVGCAIALSMIRIIYGFSILYYLLPGYAICLGLSLFAPKIYTAIAFDSGGVASGPLASSFILPLAIGACYTLSGADAILTDAFGIVSLVAMTPLIAIELLGIVAIVKDSIKSKKNIKKALKQDDQVIIEFM